MTTILYCPACGHKMAVDYQERAGGEGDPIVCPTCWHKGCKLYRYTLSEKTVRSAERLAPYKIVIAYNVDTGEPL